MLFRSRTAYTLVCETNFDNQFVFLTEKTVKPILARRLFITLGNQYHLAALQRLGFKTFHGIIDESYDKEDDDMKRLEMIMIEIEKFANKTKEEKDKFLNNIKEIVKHNQNYFLNFLQTFYLI